jgi:hypothetical protein
VESRYVHIDNALACISPAQTLLKGVKLFWFDAYPMAAFDLLKGSCICELRPS